MPVEGIRGPGLPEQISGEIALDLPDCVKLVTEKDRQEFQDFIAKIIIEARKAWETERKA